MNLFMNHKRKANLNRKCNLNFPEIRTIPMYRKSMLRLLDHHLILLGCLLQQALLLLMNYIWRLMVGRKRNVSYHASRISNMHILDIFVLQIGVYFKLYIKFMKNKIQLTC